MLAVLVDSCLDGLEAIAFVVAGGISFSLWREARK